MPRPDKYTGLYNRGTARKPRWWYRLRWPGEKQPRRGFLSTDREVALIKFEKMKRDKADYEKYGTLKWSIFKEQYFRDNMNARKTLELDRCALDMFETVVRPQFLTDLTPQNLLQAQAAWRRNHPHHSMNTLDTWKNRVITVARWAETMNIMPASSWRLIKNISKVRHRRETYTEEQYRQILASIPKFTKWYTAVMLTSESGLRRSEVFYLKFEDIDLEERIGEVVGRDGWTPKMEADDRRRYFVITPRLRDYLIELKQLSKSDYVFADLDGFRPYNPDAITRHFVRLSRPQMDNKNAHRLGFRISFHKFRHTFVTRLLDAGKGLADVRNAARHKNASTTELYDHTSAKKALRAVDIDVFPDVEKHKTEHIKKEIGESHNENKPF